VGQRCTPPSGIRAKLGAALAGLPVVMLLACTGSATRTDVNAAGSSRAAATLPVLHREDLLWLERVTFGLDTAAVVDYQRLGRERFLEHQLQAGDGVLPAPIAAQIAGLEVSHAEPAQRLADVNARYKAINALPDGPDKEQARKALNDDGNKLAYEAIRRDLLRAVYSPSQLREQMIWFWLNHFSVHQSKANLRWLVGDYEERAIRPHALGHFKDLVLATLEHPGNAAVSGQ
jgi:uncharacterized protein (DUF1800 family)